MILNIGPKFFSGHILKYAENTSLAKQITNPVKLLSLEYRSYLRTSLISFSKFCAPTMLVTNERNEHKEMFWYTN